MQPVTHPLPINYSWFDIFDDCHDSSSDGVLCCISVKCFVQRMVASNVTLFGTKKPNMKVHQFPLKKGDHPKLNDTVFTHP